ncbi:MAG: lysylphosphatidylglycerol synthase transmembrane domain-containing protein [Candidatus Omnitrophota bacterium]
MRKILLRTAISLFFIGLLFFMVRGDISAIGSVLKNIDRRLLALAVGISLCTVLVLAKRLQLIFAAEDVRIRLLEVSNLTFIGYFFNNFLPTSVGGDIVKAMCASRITGHPVKSVTSVVMDRVFGLFTFVMIPSITLLFFMKEIRNPAVPAMIYSFLGVAIACSLLLFSRRVAGRFQFIGRLLDAVHWGEKVKRIYEGLHNFRNHKGVVAEAMALSIVGQSVNILVIYLMAVALGARANAVYFFLLVPVVHLLSMLPSLNGLGIREGAYVYFLSPYIGKEYAAAVGVLWLALLLFLSLIGGIIYLVRHDYHMKFKQQEVAA